MKKLIGHTADTNNLSGRRRFANNDLEVLQSHFSQGFEKLFTGKGSFVISGGAISGTTGNFRVAPALVYINGKVVYFEGANGYAIVPATKLIEDSPLLSGERMFDLLTEKRAGIIQSRCKLTEGAAVGDSIALTIYGFAKTYESVMAESLYPAIHKRASVNIVPLGTIIMWNGDVAKFDTSGKGLTDMDGWALCNGLNGTADLRSRFVVGFDPTNADYNTFAKLGGVEKVTLQINQLPKHRHVSDIAQGVGGLIKQSQSGQPKTAVSGDSTGAGTEPNIIDSPVLDNVVGGDAAHENRPPYYVIAFCQKIAIAGVATTTPPVIVPPPPNACNLTDAQKLAVWTLTGQDAITKYFNGSWWVFQVSSYSPLELTPRGRNFLLRSDVTPVSSLPLQSCFAPEDTDQGLGYPSSFVTPTGWEVFMVGDNKRIREIGTGGGGTGGDTGINELITFTLDVI